MSKAEFKTLGYQLVDTISGFIDTIEARPVTTGETSHQLQELLGNASLPEDGAPAGEVLARAADLLLNHSLLNGHPKFLGYITASPAPLGALADLLAAAVNPNVGAQVLSPMATEIEKQTVRWLAEFIGVGPGYGGLLVSGGNMANFTAFLAALAAKAPRRCRDEGLAGAPARMAVYCPTTTHGWIEKAAILFGLGAQAVRWIPTDEANKMNPEALEQAIQSDLRAGCQPLLVVGTAGDVSTGAVDDLHALAAICKTYGLWFHVDGAYGIPAAVVPELSGLFNGIRDADSIALDPHKWLYCPLEAGCTLVKNPQHLLEAYSFHHNYYNFDSQDETRTHNYYEYGLQNSRGFRALKVWLTLQQVGRRGYEGMIRTDVALAEQLFAAARQHPELEGISQSLSIATLRYVPPPGGHAATAEDSYLNALNEALVNALQQGGEVFLSNAVVRGRYCLRACIVNFRTSAQDIDEIIEIVVREGRKVHARLQEAQPALEVRQ